MMLQELLDRWNEIQKWRSENQAGGNEQDWVAEELNILEALRILGCKEIPGTTPEIQFLISDRHKRLGDLLKKRNG